MRIKDSMTKKVDAQGNSVFFSTYTDLSFNRKYSTIHVCNKNTNKLQYIGDLYYDNEYLYCIVEYDAVKEEYLLPLGTAWFVGAAFIYFNVRGEIFSVNVNEIISNPVPKIIDATFVKRIRFDKLLSTYLHTPVKKY